MSRSWLRMLLLASGGILILTVLVGGLLLRSTAERLVASHIETWASSKGVEIQWGSLAWGTGGLLVNDVRIRRGQHSARSTWVRLALTPFSYLSGGVLVDGVHLEDTVVRFARDQAGHRAKTSAARVNVSSRRWPDWLRTLSVQNLTIRVTEAGQLIGKVGASEGRVERVGSELKIAGIASVEAPRLESPSAVSCEGYVGLGLEAAEISCRRRDEGPLEFVSSAGKVSFDDVVLNMTDSARTIGLEVRGINAERAGLEAQLPTVTLKRSNDSTEFIVQGGALRRVKRTGSQDSKSRGPYQAVEAGRTPLDQRVTTARRLLSQVMSEWGYLDRIRWEQLSIEVPGLPRITGVSGQLTHEHLEGRAVIAGGEVAFSSTWSPGWRQMDHVSVSLSGLGLGPIFALRLPALAPGRSSRGRIDGALSGRLDVFGHRVGNDQAFVFDGGLNWSDGRVELAGISDAPITGIDLGITIHGQIEPSEQRLLGHSQVTYGPIHLNSTLGVQDWRDDPVIDLTVRGRNLPCEEALATLPTTLLGPYERLAASGTFGPRVDFRWPYRRPKDIRLKFRDIIRSCEITSLNAERSGHPPVTLRNGNSISLDDVDWLNRAFVFNVVEGIEEGSRVLVGPGTADFVPLRELPPYVGAAAYLSEEMHFYKNRPIDPGLIARALRLNLEHGRFVYGGSTVTQQLVKNLFLTRSKNLARKIQEILIAARITQVVSRERVLELYLNCIEFGPNVFGIGRAARYYFQKDARQLSPREAVFLAMLKPAPRRGAGMKRRGFTPRMPYWDYRATEIMGRLVDKGYLTSEQVEAEKPYAIRWENGRYLDTKFE